METQTQNQVSRQSLNHLFHHILNGYRSSHEGIVYAKEKGLLAENEVSELLIKNGERLIKRIIEFKILERMVCVFFALMFGYMQLTSDNLELRRPRSGVRMRRRTEQTI